MGRPSRATTGKKGETRRMASRQRGRGCAGGGAGRRDEAGGGCSNLCLWRLNQGFPLAALQLFFPYTESDRAKIMQPFSGRFRTMTGHGDCPKSSYEISGTRPTVCSKVALERLKGNFKLDRTLRPVRVPPFAAYGRKSRRTALTVVSFSPRRSKIGRSTL